VIGVSRVWYWVTNHHLPRIFHTSVAQTSSLLDRRASSLPRARLGGRDRFATVCRLETGDTAGWKPALRGREKFAGMRLLLFAFVSVAL
jgi:hypothetical protein